MIGYAGETPQPADHFDAVQVGQAEVEHDEVGPGRRGDAQSVCAVGRTSTS